MQTVISLAYLEESSICCQCEPHQPNNLTLPNNLNTGLQSMHT